MQTVKLVRNTPGHKLVTPGNADELYPVPPDKLFEVDEFVTAPDLEAIGTAIIDSMGGFGYLAGLNLKYLWQGAGGKSKGKLVLGKCQKPAGLLAKFSNADFIITLAADHHRVLRSTRYQIEANIFHELCHTDLDNEKDIPEPRLVPHDVEMFCREVEIYGLWREDLDRAAKAFEQLKLGI